MIDHDRLFKELLTQFFTEFTELFLPDVARFMEPGPAEFLDKEVFTDLASSERHEVDLLAKVRFRDRGDAFFLIHVENQASAQEHFAGRMFRYFARLHEKHALPVFPVALLSYDQPRRKEPDRYRIEFPGQTVLNFRFRTVQLNRLSWRDYVRNPNPVASALMAKMRIDPKDRPRVKLECLRMLITLKLDPARATLISAFMNSYLRLNATETIAYNRQVESIDLKEREAVMEWTNEWIEQGRSEGKQTFLNELLRHRFGSGAEGLSQSLSRLGSGQLTEIADALLKFQSLSDAETWLAQHQNKFTGNPNGVRTTD